ncbi:hypothetical protein Pla86_14090 [Planctomycetes bacterium Pla86]|uniref:Uncharacterized protein n=2 Tax=Engelhardtia mirabilis TaxID=2528011 RepID=A0A518BH77_9BACT|nr:hypothetical protein Pla133_14100 [Planctomycetes bacterium Pla133]QDV00666.1 hypothetical protein Pla86_14090 [Planctomycetes bacterium Pla86]
MLAERRIEGLRVSDPWALSHEGELVALAPGRQEILLLDSGLEREVSLAFGALFTGTTCAVHFVGLTAGRQVGGGAIAWPSTAYAAELLAWDLFLGLALVFAAAAMDAAWLGARRALVASGVLCLAGTAGPAVGDMGLQRVGVLGYAVVLPLAALLLARGFAGGRGVAAADSRPRLIERGIEPELRSARLNQRARE